MTANDRATSGATRHVIARLLPGAVLLLLGACASEENVRLGPQQWQDIEVVVETRPSPVTTGMNEFIVIASRDKIKPGVGMIVSLRFNPQEDWRQAIQDGYTGVYRRALRVDDPQTGVLAVHIRNTKAGQDQEAETTLFFPLQQTALQQAPLQQVPLQQKPPQ